MDARGQLSLSVHLDTHVLLWLSQRRAKVLGAEAYRLARRQTWIVSPAVLLELDILHEIKRISSTADQVLEAARQVGDLTESASTFHDVITQARNLSWTRDPIDRLVTAHAMADGAKLLTADATILKNFKDAVWD